MEPSRKSIESRLERIEGQLFHIKIVLWVLVVLVILLLAATDPSVAHEIIPGIGLAVLAVVVAIGGIYVFLRFVELVAKAKSRGRNADQELALMADVAWTEMQNRDKPAADGRNAE